jgi:hypothetical protein
MKLTTNEQKAYANTLLENDIYAFAGSYAL